MDRRADWMRSESMGSIIEADSDDDYLNEDPVYEDSNSGDTEHVVEMGNRAGGHGFRKSIRSLASKLSPVSRVSQVKASISRMTDQLADRLDLEEEFQRTDEDRDIIQRELERQGMKGISMEFDVTSGSLQSAKRVKSDLESTQKSIRRPLKEKIDSLNAEDVLADVAKHRKDWTRKLSGSKSHILQENNLTYIAAGVIDDAWSRRWYNLDRYEADSSLKAYDLIGRPAYKLGFKCIILLHMMLVFLEPATTFLPQECGSYEHFWAQFGVEFLFLCLYSLDFVLNRIASGAQGQFFTLEKRSERGRKTHPLITATITLLIALDLLTRAVSVSVLGTSMQTFAFSRPLRALLLIANTRPLRGLFSTVLAVIPKVSLLSFVCLLGVLCYSVFAFHLFRDIYPIQSNPQTFDTWGSSTTSMFALFTVENYPEVVFQGIENGISPIFFFFFISFILLSSALLILLLGVVYNTYRQSVLKRAFKNFKKERAGLTAAFSLLASCPKDRDDCIHFPCAHGDGVLDETTWLKTFHEFKNHSKNSKVYAVQRHVREKEDTEDHIGTVAKSMFQEALEEKRKILETKSSIMKQRQTRESKKHVLRRRAVFSRPKESQKNDSRGKSPIRGSFTNRFSREKGVDDTNRISNKLLNQKTLHSILEGKSQEMKQRGHMSNTLNSLRSSFKVQSMNPDELSLGMSGTMRTFRASGNEKLDILGFFRLCDKVRVQIDSFKERPIALAKMAWLRLLQALSREQSLKTIGQWQREETIKEDEGDDHSLNSVKLKFKASFQKLSGLEKIELRRVMMENIEFLESEYGDGIDTSALKDLVQAPLPEAISSDLRWQLLIRIAVVAHFCTYVAYGFQGVTNMNADGYDDDLAVINLGFIGLYCLEWTIRLFATGSSGLQSVISLIDISVIVVSAVCSGLIYSDTIASTLDISLLRGGASLVCLRIIYIITSWIEAPVTVRNHGEVYESFIALKSIIYNVTKIMVLMFWMLLVVFYVFAVFGMELFGCSGMENTSSYVDPQRVMHFNTIQSAFLILFQLSTTNNMHEVMYGVARATITLSVLYFVTFYFLVLIVLVNLFAALIVEALVELSSKKKSSFAADQLQGMSTFDLYTRFIA